MNKQVFFTDYNILSQIDIFGLILVNIVKNNSY